jgi:CheY-like chemotaxis protein
VKFTETGQVTVKVSLKTETETSVKLHFRVSDTGIGISPDQFHLLFHSFTQLDGSASRKFGGTGLGLAISKKLVTMMGGEIGVLANQDGGTTFWFDAVFARQPASAPAAKAPPPSSRQPATATNQREIRILLAEDNSINQTLALHVLKNLGYRVVTADNGRQAVEAWGRQPFDLILMDIQMPEMDGIEATQVIRQREASRQNDQTAAGEPAPAKPQAKRHTPIIALTAHAMAGDEGKCLAAGMDDYLSKPIVPEILSTKIHKWLSDK